MVSACVLLLSFCCVASSRCKTGIPTLRRNGSLFSFFVNGEWPMVNKKSLIFDHSPLTIDDIYYYVAEHRICAIITQKFQFSEIPHLSDAKLWANLWIQSFGNERELRS